MSPRKSTRSADSPTDAANAEERLVKIDDILQRLQRIHAETARVLDQLRKTRMGKARKAHAARKKR